MFYTVGNIFLASFAVLSGLLAWAKWRDHDGAIFYLSTLLFFADFGYVLLTVLSRNTSVPSNATIAITAAIATVMLILASLVPRRR